MNVPSFIEACHSRFFPNAQSIQKWAISPGWFGRRLGQLALIVFLAWTLEFFWVHGTPDVDYWFKTWGGSALANGLWAKGYLGAGDNYPPYSFVVVGGAIVLAKHLAISSFLLFRIILYACFLFSVISAWIFSGRSAWLTLIFAFGMFVNPLWYGYLDVLMLPGVVLSYYFLRNKNYLGFSISFWLAAQMKYQVLVLAPFIALHLGRTFLRAPRRYEACVNIAKVCVLPTILFALNWLLFGPWVIGSFKMVFDRTYHSSLSGQALNFNWVVTGVLHLMNPTKYKAFSWDTSFPDTNSTILFSLVFFWLCYRFTKTELGTDSLIRYSLTGMLAYCIFGYCVHENHFFLVAVLAVLLFIQTRKYLFVCGYWAIMATINLIIFYAAPVPWISVSQTIGPLNITGVLAVLNVAAFVVTTRKLTKAPAHGYPDACRVA